MFGLHLPPFFELLQTRLNVRQCFLHLQSCVTKRLESIDIEGSFYHRRIFLQDVELFDCLFFPFLVLLSFSQTFVQILTIFVGFLLHADAHISFHPMISIINQSPRLTKRMKLADLMWNIRPEFGNRLQFRWLSIADHTKDWHLQRHNRSQDLFQPLFRTLRDIFCMKYSLS